MALDPQKLNELLGKGLVDFGATFHAALVQIGDRLGLYKALAAGGAMTPEQLAKKTNTNGTLRARMAFVASRGRLRKLRSHHAEIQYVRRADICVGR